ncbi:hypothetical protein ASAC_0081 [Acidilobus saccharovorans 345-15]|uniref:DUF58 domain-containing protein n=1 Tax=Acidilobus saccharovorans (strain DSM 16705 / JCM 18335 / VKM B-2471 / 345-15) TaxID=666510 RepID=D9PZK1_ACIS3|nr:DUF58 domain-containing protein [Acidilobus saccharovorans]ADL18489.1 hypothetical protein ASAC_0081 [Acidilobus saccharovorans 345-15]
MIGATSRGAGVLALSASLLVIGIAVGAYLLVALGVLLALASLADLAVLVASSRPTTLRPSQGEVACSAGSGATVALSHGRLRGNLVKDQLVAGLEAGEGGSLLRLSCPHAGSYLLSFVRFTLRSPLGLFEASWEDPVRPPVRASASPRFLPLAVAALAGAGAMGGQGTTAFEAPYTLPRGEDYAWTERLQPGEPAEVIDWRATARRGELMVKRFYPQGSREVSLVVDLTATDPESADELAAASLSIALGLSGSLSVTPYIYDGERLARVNGIDGLARALLERLGRHYPEAFRVLDDYPGRLRLSEGVPEGKVIAVTQLLSPLPSLLPPGCTVVQPTRPWLRAPSLEEAYLMKERHDREVSLLRASGCQVLFTYRRLTTIIM